MKKTTQKNLSKRLLKYGAFSAAILGCADASGQIVYTDIDDEVIPSGNILLIDVNDDSTGDFLFVANTAGNFNFLEPINSADADMYNSNGFVGVFNEPYAYPSNLAAGAVIDEDATFQISERGDMNYASCSFPGSQFCDGTEGFIGILLQVGADTHYGWVRVQVAVDNSSTTIKDFAYNTIPGEAIQAGQTTLSVGNFSMNEVKIVTADKTIEFYNLPENSTFRLFDIAGKSVLNGSSTKKESYIDVSSILKGIYIIEVADTNTSATIRKKVIL